MAPAWGSVHTDRIRAVWVRRGQARRTRLVEIADHLSILATRARVLEAADPREAGLGDDLDAYATELRAMVRR